MLLGTPSMYYMKAPLKGVTAVQNLEMRAVVMRGGEF